MMFTLLNNELYIAATALNCSTINSKVELMFSMKMRIASLVNLIHTEE